MPIPLAAVGCRVGPTRTHVDARWLRAFAVGVGDGRCNAYRVDPGAKAVARPTHDFHVRGLQGAGVLAHPLFVWAVEWPTLWLRASELFGGQGTLVDGERGRAVHYAQDVVVHGRPLQAGDDVRSVCQLVGVEARRHGTLVQYRFDHTCARTGRPMVTTWQSAYWRGVPLLMQTTEEEEEVVVEEEEKTDRRKKTKTRCWLEDRMAPPPPPLLPPSRHRADATIRIPLPIAADEGTVYAEMARIWNPIHTDPAAARASGLPAPILHGTSTMAKCVSAVVRRFGGDDPRRVRRVGVARFEAPVFMPSTVWCCVRGVARDGAVVVVHYQAENGNGEAVLSGGFVVLRQGAGPAGKL